MGKKRDREKSSAHTTPEQISKRDKMTDSELEIPDPTEMESLFSKMFRESEERMKTFYCNEVGSLKEELKTALDNASQVPILQEKVTKLESKMKLLEAREKKYNIIVHGIECKKFENETEKLAVIQDLAKKLKLTGIDYSDAIRLGPKSAQKRPLLIKLLRYQDKVKILASAKNLAGSEISIKEDLTPEQRKANVILAKTKKAIMEKIPDAKIQIRNNKMVMREGNKVSTFVANLETEEAVQLNPPQQASSERMESD